MNVNNIFFNGLSSLSMNIHPISINIPKKNFVVCGVCRRSVIIVAIIITAETITRNFVLPYLAESTLA